LLQGKPRAGTMKTSKTVPVSVSLPTGITMIVRVLRSDLVLLTAHNAVDTYINTVTKDYIRYTPARGFFFSDPGFIGADIERQAAAYV
jgi:hypothetical protein